MSERLTLKVHPLFFKEFASKTWTSASRVVAELVENSFDEDATRVLVTVLNDGSIIVEDDAGMDEDALRRFLLVGSPHKQEEQRSPRFKRLRSGRYGIGRLSFLTAFKRMTVKTRRDKFHSAFELDENVLARLASGKAMLRQVDEPPLNRDGTEIRLLEPRGKVEYLRLMRELRKLECLKQPFFELYLKSSSKLMEWSFTGAERVTPPRINGLRIPISELGLEGEIIISKKPLPEDERGLAVIVGGHAVCRSSFGISGVAAERITGWVRGEGLTARFADKSALVEDDAYERFSRRVKSLLKEKVIPTMNEYVEVEITREELRVYRQVDQLLADAVHRVFESTEEDDLASESKVTRIEDEEAKEILVPTLSNGQPPSTERGGFETPKEPVLALKELGNCNSMRTGEKLLACLEGEKDRNDAYGLSTDLDEVSRQRSIPISNPSLSRPGSITVHSMPLVENSVQQNWSLKRVFKAVGSGQVRRTFKLKRVGYRVVPYEDEYDCREAFAEGEVIYVNKAHPVYRAEAEKGRELLLRHIVRLVSKVIALNYHPEGREALELQNRLIAEAIRLRQNRSPRKMAS